MRSWPRAPHAISDEGWYGTSGVCVPWVGIVQLRVWEWRVQENGRGDARATDERRKRSVSFRPRRTRPLASW